jgi:hypothetical protein
MPYFQGLLAEVVYAPRRAYEVKRDIFLKKPGQKEVECFLYRLKEGELPNPLEREPRFWEKVHQLAFSFENGKINQVEDFLRQCGPIFPSKQAGIEEVEVLRQCLYFFRELTNWVRWAREGRLEPLQERIEEGQLLLDTTTFEDSPEVRYSPIPRTPPDIPSGIFSTETSNRQPTVHNVSIIETFTVDAVLAYTMIIPSSMERLPSLAWEVVPRAIARYLKSIPLVPEAKEGRILFRFKARGALDAAFLQWYFQEFNVYRTCEAEGCNNPVFRINAKYCSKRCKNREKQRRHRQKLKEGRR